MDVPQLVYTFTYWRIFYLLLACEARCPCLELWILRKWPKDTRSIEINSDDTISTIQWPPEVVSFCCLVNKLCLILWDPMDYSPPDFSVHGISQARILEWVAISSSRGSSRPGDWSHVSCTGRLDSLPLSQKSRSVLSISVKMLDSSRH